MISTFSAINASLYGGSRVNYEIAEDDELPKQFTSQLWNQPIGLLITAILTLVLVNSLQLESISTAGSVGFLLIFAIVNVVGFKLAKDIGGSRFLPMIGAILCFFAMVALLIQQYFTSKLDVFIAIGIVAFSFIIELIYKKTVPNNGNRCTTTPFKE